MTVPGTGVISINHSTAALDVELPPLRIRERNFSIENPSYPLDDPSVWADGMISDAGTRVNHTTSLRVPAVYQAVTRISGDTARCPLELEGLTEGAWSPLRTDPLYRIVAIQPNREMDAFTFWSRMMVYRLMWMNAYAFIVRDARGQVAELVPLLPDRTRPLRKGGTLSYETEVNGNKEPIPAASVLHFQGIGFDNVQGLDLVSAARDAWGLALAQIGFASKFFRRGGRMGGILEIPTSTTKTSADRLEAGFRNKYESADAAFLTVILRENAKFHTAQATLRESQGVEGREESVRDVARHFNMRPSLLGVESGVSYGSKYEDSRDYLDATLAPHFAAITAHCLIKLLPLEEQLNKRFHHNTDEILRQSPNEVMTTLAAGVAGTVLTSNEARQAWGLPPHDDGDQLRNPNTVSNVPGQQPPPAIPAKKKPPAKKKSGAAGDDNEELNALRRRHSELVARNVDDVIAVLGEQARNATKSGAKFCAWIDEKLPTKRLNFERAGLDPEFAEARHASITRGLQEIASAASEVELRQRVTDYFAAIGPTNDQTRSNEPCQTNKAA